jgi:hypothetical protein
MIHKPPFTASRQAGRQASHHPSANHYKRLTTMGLTVVIRKGGRELA